MLLGPLILWRSAEYLTSQGLKRAFWRTKNSRNLAASKRKKEVYPQDLKRTSCGCQLKEMVTTYLGSFIMHLILRQEHSSFLLKFERKITQMTESQNVRTWRYACVWVILETDHWHCLVIPDQIDLIGGWLRSRWLVRYHRWRPDWGATGVRSGSIHMRVEERCTTCKEEHAFQDM